jgi:hypothetical protein
MCGGKVLDISIQEQISLRWHGVALPHHFPIAEAEPQKQERNDFIFQPDCWGENLPARVSQGGTSCNVGM